MCIRRVLLPYYPWQFGVPYSFSRNSMLTKILNSTADITLPRFTPLNIKAKHFCFVITLNYAIRSQRQLFIQPSSITLINPPHDLKTL